jgi:hypothetical protein
MSLPALVTGVICTRNRPEPLARLVSTLLAGESEPCELLVVDQSDELLYQRARASYCPKTYGCDTYVRRAGQGQGAERGAPPGAGHDSGLHG